MKIIVLVCILYILLIYNLYFINYYRSKDGYYFNKIFNTFDISHDSLANIMNSKNTLYIVSHDYEHIDIFAVESLIRLSHNHSHLVFFDAWWNKCLQIYQLMYDNIHILYTGTGVVAKSCHQLNMGHNVFIWQYQWNNQSGIFHIKRNTQCKVKLLKIESNCEPVNHSNADKLSIISSYFFQKFSINIIDFDFPALCKNDYIHDLFHFSN